MLLLAALLIAGCAAGTDVNLTPSSGTLSPATAGPNASLGATAPPTAGPIASLGPLPTSASTPRPPPSLAAPLPPWLVGTWTQSNYTGSATGGQTQRIYRFHPEGVYEYWHLLCPTFDQCDGPYEWGTVDLGQTVIGFVPQTPSAEGPRAFEYAVAQDVIGAWTLRLGLPGGLVDVFYLER